MYSTLNIEGILTDEDAIFHIHTNAKYVQQYNI